MRRNGVDLGLSTDGALIYSSIEFQEGPDQVVWVDREGTEASAEPWIEDFGDLALSPDGSLLVVSIRTNGVTELWVRQGEAGPLSRLTYATDGSSSEPAWTPDSRSVAHFGRLGSERSIRVRRADGSTPAQTRFSWNRDIDRIAWTPDGSTLIFSANVQDGLDIFSIRPGLDSVPTPLLTEPFSKPDPAVSPDGQWLPYTSNESGRRELYVRPFPDVGASHTWITSEGACRPRWSATGDQLFYVTSRNETASSDELRSVDFFPGPPVRVAAERVIFSKPPSVIGG